MRLPVEMRRSNGAQRLWPPRTDDLVVIASDRTQVHLAVRQVGAAVDILGCTRRPRLLDKRASLFELLKDRAGLFGEVGQLASLDRPLTRHAPEMVTRDHWIVEIDDRLFGRAIQEDFRVGQVIRARSSD